VPHTKKTTTKKWGRKTREEMEKEECDKNQGSEIVPIQEVNPLRMILSEKITSLATLMSTSMMYQ
jgi:hypothetical protein